MRIAVIGMGRMGSLHARLLREASGALSLVLADRDIARANRAAAALDGLALSDPLAALDAADAAIIATPPDSHAELVTAAVERGRPVMCEKPLAQDFLQAMAVAQRVQQAGVPVQVGFHRRFDPGLLAARSLIQEGRVGRLHLLRLTGTEPVLPPSSLTNLFRNTAVHDFDLVRWLSGDEITSVFAEAASRHGGPFDPRLDPDTITAVLKLRSGGLGLISISRLSALGYDVRAEIVGSKDHVSVGWTDRSPIHSVETSGTPLQPAIWKTWQDRFEDAYRAELTAFLAVAAGRRGVPVTVEDAVEAQRIAEAARRSAQTGTRISVDNGVTETSRDPRSTSTIQPDR